MLNNYLKIAIKEEEYYVARSESDSPEVDNEIIIETTKKIKPGEIHQAYITSASDYDLVAKI